MPRDVWTLVIQFLNDEGILGLTGTCVALASITHRKPSLDKVLLKSVSLKVASVSRGRAITDPTRLRLEDTLHIHLLEAIYSYYGAWCHELCTRPDAHTKYKKGATVAIRREEELARVLPKRWTKSLPKAISDLLLGPYLAYDRLAGCVVDK
jgi:hypothetical protein